MDTFAATYPNELHIWHLDLGRFHTAKKLQIPENIILLLQPAHSPELNPIERLWEHIKGMLSWELFPTLDALREKVNQILLGLSAKDIASLTGWNYIIQALSVAGLAGNGINRRQNE